MGNRILVVDDEENIRLLFKEELVEEGYEVEVAANAEDAAGKIETFKPDLITLDIKMPGMDGIEFLRRLKEKNTKAKIIICSAYGSFKQDFRTWASEAYVVKSADLNELKSTIRKVLSS
ncbi:MAG: response regulator [Nitrospinae bacterium]|nr:response regulator [Nitrospinota bacterium]